MILSKEDIAFRRWAADAVGNDDAVALLDSHEALRAENERLKAALQQRQEGCRKVSNA